ASFALNVKAASAEPLGLVGLESIDGTGSVVSIVHVNEAGVASALPAPSIASTWNVCEPSEGTKYDFGLVEVEKLPASSLHLKLATPESSVPLNENVAVPEFVGSDGCVPPIEVSGAVWSTDHVYEAGVASALPWKSIARTWKVCEPS